MQSIQAVVVMGVSGSGKSTIGKLLAERLGWVFRDADDDHPSENVAKMASGTPLTDADRAPWLAILARRIANAQSNNQPLVLACSALKQSYRDQLAAGSSGVRFVYLKGTREEIAARVAERHHFMPASLLDSQFATLEEPDDAIVVSIMQTKSAIVDAIVQALANADAASDQTDASG